MRGGFLVSIMAGPAILAVGILGAARSDVGKHAGSDPLVPRISSEVPSDFFSPAVPPNRTLDRLQHDFDIYSWETFIALNWPVDAKGNALPQQRIGNTPTGDHATVWENWKSTGDLFLPDGQEPKKWGVREDLRVLFPHKPLNKTATNQEIKEDKHLFDLNQRIPDETGGGTVTLGEVYRDPVKYRFITKMAKGHSWFSTGQAFETGPLIDQAGNYARYEILMNEDAYNYVRDNELYHEGGQQAFFSGQDKRHVVFPIGRFKYGPDDMRILDADMRPVNGTTGAIFIKAAWKPLTKAEVQSGRFHARRTLVYTPKDDVNSIKKADLKIVWMGLVGLHIVHKSEDVAQWNWATFEQVNNCPDYKDRAVKLDKNGKKKTYSYYNPDRYDKALPDPDRPLNRPPERPWNPLEIATEERRSQIVRMLPVTSDAEALNQELHEQLRKQNPRSVWQYYKLVSTQWPTRPAGLALPPNHKDGDVLKIAPADITGGPAPLFLGNTTMESYIQGEAPNTSSSCMDCHANATTKTGPKGQVQFADFTYILERAQRRPSK